MPKKKALLNQPERRWLAELEARMDARERSAVHAAVSVGRAHATASMAFEESRAWRKKTRTVWQRLRWVLFG